jgi:hypothetical protein
MADEDVVELDNLVIDLANVHKEVETDIVTLRRRQMARLRTGKMKPQEERRGCRAVRDYDCHC